MSAGGLGGCVPARSGCGRVRPGGLRSFLRPPQSRRKLPKPLPGDAFRGAETRRCCRSRVWPRLLRRGQSWAVPRCLSLSRGTPGRAVALALMWRIRDAPASGTRSVCKGRHSRFTPSRVPAFHFFSFFFPFIKTKIPSDGNERRCCFRGG